MDSIFKKDNNGRLKRHTLELLASGTKNVAYQIYKTSPAQTNFKIDLDITEIPNEYKGSLYETWLYDAVNFLEQIITGVNYSSEQRTIPVKVTFDQLIFGENHFSGQGGPGNMATNFNGNIDISEILQTFDAIDIYENYITVKSGSIKFCSCSQCHPIGNPQQRFFYTALHELFHVLGFGALWNGNFRLITGPAGTTSLPDLIANANVFPWNLLVTLLGFGPVLSSGINPNSNNIGIGSPIDPKYIGPQGLAAYDEATYDLQMFIPIHPSTNPVATVQNAGGSALSHWGFRAPGADPNGPFYNELMNYTTTTNSFVSKFTVASMEDIGYAVDYSALDIPLANFMSN